MKAIAFDLGDTLVEYEGIPLSWEAHYPDALRQLANQLGISIGDRQVAMGCSVLRKFNTRLNPRSHEIAFSTILAELCTRWEIIAPVSVENDYAKAFFQIFRRHLRCFPETRQVLRKLREARHPIGILTDVPYGMPRELVIEDLRDSGIDGLYDVLLTSRDVGYRKPSPQTLGALATALNCSAANLVCVGNEKKDIEVAQAFGCRSVLVNRTGKEISWGQHHTVESLTELDEGNALSE